jgi:predicted metal-dependent HD superfamily phosphohydrolase
MSAGAAWVDAARRVGSTRVAATAAANDLVIRYAESHRRYHDAAHVEAVVRDAGWLGAELGLSEEERAVVTLAACAHDVVYDGRPGADERASAEWARARLVDGGVPAETADAVARLVLATVDHRADPGDLLAGALLDADLAILGADPGDYARYVAAVREEYASVPDDAWRTGRARVLRDLLAGGSLYVTAPARRRWGEHATTNVRRELSGLVEDVRPAPEAPSLS